MGDRLNFQLRNSLDAINPAKQQAEAWLQLHKAASEVSGLVQLAIEELVTNCIKYAYSDDGEHVIEIALDIADHTLTLLMVDDGRPFDPLTAPPPDLSLPIERRLAGGFGIHLLRNLSDGFVYERRDHRNRVTVTKRMSAG